MCIRYSGYVIDLWFYNVAVPQWLHHPFVTSFGRPGYRATRVCGESRCCESSYVLHLHLHRVQDRDPPLSAVMRVFVSDVSGRVGRAVRAALVEADPEREIVGTLASGDCPKGVAAVAEVRSNA